MNTIFRCFLGLLLPSCLAMAAFTPANRPIDALHYSIKLEIDPSANPDTFEADAEMKFKTISAIEAFTLDLDELDIQKVSLIKGGKQVPLDFDTKNPKLLQIRLPKKSKAGETFTIVTHYKGKVRSAHQGLFKVVDPDEPARGPLLFTHFEPLGARGFFPCNDEPYDKATTEMHVRVPARYEVVSNGTHVGTKKTTRDKQSWREFHWKLDKPHPTYLVSLAIAPFAKIESKHGGKTLSVWVGETKKEKAAYCLDVTGKALDFFEGYLGVKYPWPKYATVGLPTFLWGGMENTSATHMNQERTVLNDSKSAYEKKRIVGLAAHELAHQWFGDFVTMKWWDDVWLNEAFASHMGTLATRKIFDNEEADLEVVVDTWDNYFRQEDGPRSHPIVDRGLSSPDDAFDAISYTKGENVLKMLSFYVGEDKFKQGLKKYLTQNKFGNATYLDFFSAIEGASGQNLKEFRDSWLLQRGYPVVTYAGTWDAAKSLYQLTLNQKPNHPEDKSLFKFRIPVVFNRKTTPAFSKQVIVEMGNATETVTVTANLLAEPEWVTVNPGSVVLAKVQQEKRDEATLALQALHDEDPIARLWAAYTLSQNVIEGGDVTAFAQKTLIQILEEDPSPYVRIALLTTFHRMNSRWFPEPLGEGIRNNTVAALTPYTDNTPFYLSDAHGWGQWRTKLLGSLGRVKNPEALKMLETWLSRKNLPLDDLTESALSVASWGDPKSVDILKAALKLHGDRGYRYRYSILYAFGALESPLAANEIREIAKTSGSDLMGRIGWAVRDNQTLKNSPEWAAFLKDFILTDTRFGDEIKARILQSIEEVKSNEVQSLLQAVSTKSGSDRLRQASQKILEKNFAERAIATEKPATR